MLRIRSHFHQIQISIRILLEYPYLTCIKKALFPTWFRHLWNSIWKINWYFICRLRIQIRFLPDLVNPKRLDLTGSGSATLIIWIIMKSPHAALWLAVWSNMVKEHLEGSIDPMNIGIVLIKLYYHNSLSHIFCQIGSRNVYMTGKVQMIDYWITWLIFILLLITCVRTNNRHCVSKAIITLPENWYSHSVHRPECTLGNT